MKLVSVLFLFAVTANNFANNKEGSSESGLIGGIDYMGHNVGLINKHGWEFNSQRLFDGYLKNYYTETANVIAEKMGRASAWIPDGTLDVRAYKYDSNDVVNPGDHVIDTFGHIRPAIVRYWSGP